MTTISKVSRRSFLQTTGLSASFILGAHISPRCLFAAMSGATTAQPNYFVAIAADGTVTLTNSRSEMGQGVRTGMPMMIAEELEADWSRVKIWQAPGDATKYDPAGKDQQNTDGSRSTRHGFNVMRELGASAREVLEKAAAQKWGVDASEVYAKNHRLYHRGTDRSLDFGEVVEIAAEIDVPFGADAPKPKLKDPSQWRYIGKDMPVVDNFDMSTGGADYGADYTLPGMKIAVVARPPVYRGKVKSFDATEALKVPGVEQVIEIPALPNDKPAEFRALGGVAVIGRNTWSVMQGRKKLKIEWDAGPFVGHDSSTYDAALIASSQQPGTVIRKRGDVDLAFAQADKVVEAEYFVPYLAHAPMEPPVALVDANSRPVQIITSTQAPLQTRQYVAEALGLEIADVECQITLLGGAFGRKSKPDFACEAAILSKAIGAPVRVQWSREDEIQHGYYHSASAQYAKAALDKDGKVIAWQQRVASPSIMALWNPAQDGPVDFEAALGLTDMPYNTIPNLQLETCKAPAMIRVGWLRSVNNIQHAFALHSFADELAAAAGRDPLEFLLETIGDAEVMDLSKDGVEGDTVYGDPVADYPISPKRLSNTLRIVAKAAGYGQQLPEGSGIGLAAHRSFQSYVAIAVQVKVGENGEFSVPRVDVAIDCGRYVNPEGVRKQMEGACTFGHSIARFGKITTTLGAVDQSNFNDYRVTRLSEGPLDIHVHLVEDYVTELPCGVGEPGVPPYAPALLNAIYQAIGKRIRTLPLPADLRTA
ncbi:MAG: molybdopterin cofactor-binding domain-containing protein [Xanthomonadales bacterium]|nr:molybdopterin cofactor-binding domain-containing protein [Xanthomonadales bacterium]